MIQPRLSDRQRRRLRRENTLWFAVAVGIVVAFGLLAAFADRLA